jgi:hypothetical protein
MAVASLTVAWDVPIRRRGLHWSIGGLHPTVRCLWLVAGKATVLWTSETYGRTHALYGR